jgi:hypothetical protein
MQDGIPFLADPVVQAAIIELRRSDCDPSGTRKSSRLVSGGMAVPALGWGGSTARPAAGALFRPFVFQSTEMDATLLPDAKPAICAEGGPCCVSLP